MSTLRSTSTFRPLMDQASGLRRRFQQQPRRFVPVLANPNLASSMALLERLCHAMAALDLHAALIDALADVDGAAVAPDAAPMPHFEALTPQLSYLSLNAELGAEAASFGSDGLLALADAAPQADVILVHASAPMLTALFDALVRAGGALHPVVLCDEQPQAITSAYAGLKQLAQHAGTRRHELLLAAPTGSRRAPQVATRIAQCAHAFAQVTQQHWVSVDPASLDGAPAHDDVDRVVGDLLMAAWLQSDHGANCGASQPTP